MDSYRTYHRFIFINDRWFRGSLWASLIKLDSWWRIWGGKIVFICMTKNKSTKLIGPLRCHLDSCFWHLAKSQSIFSLLLLGLPSPYGSTCWPLARWHAANIHPRVSRAHLLHWSRDWNCIFFNFCLRNSLLHFYCN